MSDQKRAANFSSFEIEIEKLLAIIETKKRILECKKSDRVSVDMKEKCWDEICVEFNAEVGTGRSKKVLRDKYHNLKKSLKRTNSEVRKSLYSTGGGPATSHIYSASEEQLLRIVHEKEVNGRESYYDGDHIKYGNATAPEDGEQQQDEMGNDEADMHEVEVLEEYEEEFKDGKVNWTKYTPNMLKTPKNKKLETNLKSNTKSSWDDLAYTKKKCAEEDLNMRRKEHELLVRREEEGRSQRLLEHEQRMRHAEEEHQLKMEILKTELAVKKRRLQNA